MLVESDFALVRDISEKLCGRASYQTIAYIVRKRLGKEVTEIDVKEVLAKDEAAMPPINTILLETDQRNPSQARKFCTDVINEMKSVVVTSNSKGFNPNVDYTPCGLSSVLFLSDLHLGELVEVNGKTIYDLEIAEERLNSILNQFIKAPEIESYIVDELVLVLGGDIIDGELVYPTQSTRTVGDAYTQVQAAVIMIWNGIVKLVDSGRFPVINIYCVPGNHGRTSKIHSDMSNWDNVLYFALALMALNHGLGVELNVFTPHQMWMDFKIRTWRAHVRHIGVTQVSTASPGRKVLNWMDGHQADLLMFGHYHNPEMFSLGDRRVFKNGSLSPMNEYAEKFGFLDGAGQWMFGVTDKDSVAFAKIIVPEV